MKQNGDTAITATEVRNAFQMQFTSANLRAMDESILDEMPNVPIHNFPSIAVNEILEALEETSNTSALAPTG